MALDPKIHQANRRSWNAATAAHNSHKRDQAAFLRRGGTTLFAEELDLLGELDGKRLAHLLCNCGQDTLSLASRGAEVVGVDISDQAVEFARQLARDSGLGGSFVRADIYDWLAETAASGRRFDIVFCSYGALVWLSGLNAWARGVASILEPEGIFAAVEFHPLLLTLEQDWTPRYPYFGSDQAVRTEGVPDYVAEAGSALAPSGWQSGVVDFVNPHPDFTFPWSLSQVMGALLAAGLTLERFEEYPYSNGGYTLQGMKADAQGRFWPPPGRPRWPLMYGLRMRR